MSRLGLNDILRERMVKMYLKIANDTKTKSYRLTESAEKPYIVVQTSKSDGGGTTTSKSYLPLTTKPGTGLRMNIKSGTETYRPMEYKSASSSETYYSSSENVGNLSSTTALTRESTSNTVYETVVKTTKTIYGTKTVYAATCYFGATSNQFEIIEFTTSQRNASRYTFYGPRSMIVLGSLTNSIAFSGGINNATTRARTTATNYQTAVSTTNTIYQTRSSTSGYTGVSSSSYESTGWQ